MNFPNRLKIQQSFTQQASRFESDQMNFSRKDYLDSVIYKIAPANPDAVLEVAAGTCACGRAIAPFVKSVTCLDITPPC